MSENIALNRVINHLSQLAKQTAQVTDMALRRACIDEYFNVSDQLDDNPCVREVTIDTLTAHWVSPLALNTERRMLYIHGGSWMSGSIKGYHQFIRLLAEACQCHILFVDYALMPESPFPAGLNDCLNAYQWLLKHTPEGTSKNQSVFLGGDSAGGNLCLASLLACKKDKIPLPKAAFALSPCTDLHFNNSSIRSRQNQDPIINGTALPLLAQLYTQKKYNLNNPLISPIYGDLKGLPPILLQTGTAEVLLDDSRLFAEKAKQAGVNIELDLWEGMPHVFQGFAHQLPEAKDALIKIAQFIQQY